MNGVFAAMFVLSTLLFLIFDPEGFLPALASGGEKAVSLSLSLAAAYCVWLGFFGVMEQSGLTRLLARAVRPAARRLFRSDDETALSAACCAISANLLSLPGAPTPLGIEAGVAADALTCALMPPAGVELDQSRAHLRVQRLVDVVGLVQTAALHGIA